MTGFGQNVGLVLQALLSTSPMGQIHFALRSGAYHVHILF
jgi:hypothetical protein